MGKSRAKKQREHVKRNHLGYVEKYSRGYSEMSLHERKKPTLVEKMRKKERKHKNGIENDYESGYKGIYLVS